MAGYDFTAIEKKWQDYWRDHETFRQPNPEQQGFAGQAQNVRAGHVPLPVRRGAARGAPGGLHRHRHRLPLRADDAATTSCTRWATTRSACPPSSTPSSTACTRARPPRKNIANIERQIRMFGFSYDWSRARGHHRRGVLPLDAVDLPADVQQLVRSGGRRRPADRRARPQAGKRRVQGGRRRQHRPRRRAATARAPTAARRPGFANTATSTADQQRRLIDEYRLAYMAEVPVNWCPALGTVLANEEVTNEGRSERGNHPVFRRALRQWMLRITAYAERLRGRPRRASTGPSRSRSCSATGSARAAARRWTSPWRGAAGEQLLDDRAEGGFPVRARRRRHPRLHHPPGHAVRRDVHGPRAGAPARRRDHHAPSSATPSRPTCDNGGAQDRPRAHGRGQGEDRRVHRRLRHQPGQRRARSRSGWPTTC